MQLKAYLKLEEEDFTTTFQRRNIKVNDAGLVFIVQRRDVSTS